MKKKRIIGYIVLVAIVFGVICWIFGEGPTSKSRIERITGVEFPEYVIKTHNEGNRSFGGDCTDYYTMEFKETPSQEFYSALERKCKEKDSGWSNGYGKGEYCFDRMWGNGMPAPEGESESSDEFIGIKITKGDKEFEIKVGTW